MRVAPDYPHMLAVAALLYMLAVAALLYMLAVAARALSPQK